MCLQIAWAFKLVSILILPKTHCVCQCLLFWCTLSKSVCCLLLSSQFVLHLLRCLHTLKYSGCSRSFQFLPLKPCERIFQSFPGGVCRFQRFSECRLARHLLLLLACFVVCLFRNAHWH